MEANLNNLLNLAGNIGTLTGVESPFAVTEDIRLLNNLISHYQTVCQLGTLIKQQIVQHPCYPQFIENALRIPYLAYNYQSEDHFKYEEQCASTQDILYSKSEEVQTQKSSSPTSRQKDSVSTTPQSDSLNNSSVKSENDESAAPEKVKEEVLIQENDEDKEDSPKIRRRNGFKGEYKEEEENKSNKMNEKNRSKAKHLWISYGRQIAIYAAKHTEGKTKRRIQECEHKLKSKKAYFEVFKITKTDSQEDRDFKLIFGKLALEFLKNHAEDAFPSSNYRDDLLAQKEKVSSWISSHISLE